MFPMSCNTHYMTRSVLFSQSSQISEKCLRPGSIRSPGHRLGGVSHMFPAAYKAFPWGSVVSFHLLTKTELATHTQGAIMQKTCLSFYFIYFFPPVTLPFPPSAVTENLFRMFPRRSFFFLLQTPKILSKPCRLKLYYWIR